LLLFERTGTDKLTRESKEGLKKSEDKSLKIKTLFSSFLEGEARVGERKKLKSLSIGF